MASTVNGAWAINKPPIYLLVPICCSWLSNGRSSHLSLNRPPEWGLMTTGALDNVLPLDNFVLLSASGQHGLLTAGVQSHTSTTRHDFQLQGKTKRNTHTCTHTARKSYLLKCFPWDSYFQNKMFYVLSCGKKKASQSHSLWIDFFFFSNVFSFNCRNNSSRVW